MTAFVARQSFVRSVQACPRRAWHELETAGLTTGNTEARADLGTVAHAIFAEILLTLRRQGERQLPTEEAMVIAREVQAKLPIILPAQEADELRMLVLKFATDYEWSSERLVAVEQRMRAEIVCPDGVTRVLTGQPDAIFATSTETAVIVDHKTGWPATRRPREEQNNPDGVIVGREYLSDQGLVQLYLYGLLTMHTYPAVQRVSLYEAHVRVGEKRQAGLERSELENVEAQLGLQLQQLDQAIQGGAQSPLWRPRPGKHCQRQCPVSATCPIPKEQRGRGAIENDADADDVAGRFVMVDGLRGHLRELLKTNWSETGRPARVGDGTVVVWDQGKGSAFGIVSEADYEAARAAGSEAV